MTPASFNGATLCAAIVLSSAGCAVGKDVIGVEIVTATTPFLVDGRAVGPTPGVPLALPPGSTVDTRSGVVRIRTTSGDEIELTPSSRLRSEGSLAGVERLNLLAGRADATIRGRTSLGSTAGWVAPLADAAVEVRLCVYGGAAGTLGPGIEGESPEPEPTGPESMSVESSRGGVWVRCAAADLWVPEGVLVRLEPGPRAGRALRFRAEPRRGASSITVVAGRGSPSESRAEVPPGLEGSVESIPAGGGTRWTCVSDRFGMRRLIELRAKPSGRICARLAPGLACVVDERGRVQVEVPGASPETLERLLALEEEFRAR